MNDTRFEHCIKCTVCTTACPVSRVNPRYPGPKQAGPDGERLWIQPVVSDSEGELDAYIARQRGYDPDLWVVEIEDRQGRHFITEKVQDGG